MRYSIENGYYAKQYFFDNKYHRIDGPAFIKHKPYKPKNVEFILYFLYGKKFVPWWLNES